MLSEDSQSYVKKPGCTSNLKFNGSTSQIRHLADILSSIVSINRYASVSISTSGIEIYAESNHICNANVTIERNIFNYYSLFSESAEEERRNVKVLKLGIDVSAVSEAFSAALSSLLPKSKSKDIEPVAHATSNNGTLECYITYNGEGHPLVIEFEDNLMTEKIEFSTFYLDSEYSYGTDSFEEESKNASLFINHDELEFEAIIKSDIFSKMLRDLQQINITELSIQACKEFKHLGRKNTTKIGTKDSGVRILDTQLNFISEGPIGISKLMYPNNKSALEKLEIYENTSQRNSINTSLVFSFNFQIFNKIAKAVRLSIKCKLMKDSSGVFMIQLICKNAAMPSYPGSLITFCMLELSQKSSRGDDAIDISKLFDSKAFDYIQTYSDINQRENAYNLEKNKMNNVQLSYSAFKLNAIDEGSNLPIASQTEEIGETEKLQNLRSNDSELPFFI